MRRSVRFTAAVGAVALAAGALAAVAGGTITATALQAKLIAAPPSVKFDDLSADPATNGDLESNEFVHVFDEQQCVTLAADIPVDITQPGTYDSEASLTPGVISAGTRVSSHFMHVDKVGHAIPFVHLEGQITTDTDILGLAVTARTLNATDGPLGHPSTTYPTGDFGRHLELDNDRQDDRVIEFADLRTVFLHSDDRLHADQVRVITRCPKTDITVSKSDSPDPVEVNQSLTYTLTVFNAGPDTAKDVVLTDTLPSSVTFVSADAPCTYGLGIVTCNLGDLAAGATVQKQILVKPTQVGTITNDVCVATTTAETDTSNNCDSEPTVVKAPPPPPEELGREGCSPGYWKQSHHFDSWQGYSPHQTYQSVFGVGTFGSKTLVQVLSTGGGGANALGRMSVAALLNAKNTTVDFPITSEQVISQTKAALLSGNKNQIESLKNQLDAWVNLGCPLS